MQFFERVINWILPSSPHSWMKPRKKSGLLNTLNTRPSSLTTLVWSQKKKTLKRENFLCCALSHFPSQFHQANQAKMSKDEKTPTFSVTSTDNPKSQLYNTSQHESASNPYHPAQVESRPSYTEPQSSSPKDPFLAHLAKLITVQEETNRLQQQTNQYLQRRAAEEQAERERKNERREEDAVEEYAMKNISYCEEFCKATMAVSTLGASGCCSSLLLSLSPPSIKIWEGCSWRNVKL